MTTLEHLRPDEGDLLPLDEFARVAGLPEADVRELLAYGLLTKERLDLRDALALREAVRLKHDFDLDLFSTGLLAGYVLRVRALQAELATLRAERPGQTMAVEVSVTSVQIGRMP